MTEWKYIEGFNKRYVISNTGKVYDKHLGKRMLESKNGTVWLMDENYSTKNKNIHARGRKVSALMKKYFPKMKEV